MVANDLILVKSIDSPNPFSFKIIAKANSKFGLKIKEALGISLKNLT